MGYKKDDEYKPLNKEGSELVDSTHTDPSGKVIPNSLNQNPSPLENVGQDFYTVHRDQVEEIMKTFLQMLPSNYVSQVRGPFYTLQFQAVAEQIAKIQVMSQEVFADSDFDFTRTEFLYQILGVLVNPKYKENAFVFDTDLELRDFLRRMIVLLLNGSRKASVQQGIYLLTEGDITIIEKSYEIKNTFNSDYTLADQFEFEISLSVINQTNEVEDHTHIISIDKDGNGKTTDGDHTHEVYQFEVLPSEEGGHTHILVSEFSKTIQKLFNNLEITLDILKPAHSIYEFRHLFREVFGVLFSDTVTMDFNYSYYDDFRKFCEGAKEISGTGETLIDRTLFTDPTKNFRSVSVDATLEILDGDNERSYRVKEILSLPIGEDSTPRAYTTSNGLSGTLTVLSNDTVEDTSQDFSGCPEGTTLSILAGGNQGTYRMEFLLGENDGAVGFTSGSASQVKLGYSTVRVTQRMSKAVSNQSYRLVVDRLGVRQPVTVTNEDNSSQFYL